MEILTNQQIDNQPNKQLDRQWFIVRTKARFEKKVAQQLTELGYQTYLPLETKIRIWSDRKKKIQTPLIPSFVFIQNPNVSKDLIYTIPGFCNFLKLNGELGKVTPQEIEHLRILTSEELDFDAVKLDSYKKGEEVQIISGPFRGLFANAVEETGNFRVLIEIPSLGIGYNVSIPKNKIVKVTKN
ncbi:MAG: UpxY family transcription antiterminator [Brumimicrobium sp.]|nr:UpxY family transcription antiterminator [Brumimicrobium sp.]